MLRPHLLCHGKNVLVKQNYKPKLASPCSCGSRAEAIAGAFPAPPPSPA
ncbi:hypothetical protein [Nitrobacter sp.]